METEVVAFVIDVAGESAEPAFAETRPEQGAHGGDDEAGDDEQFSQIRHFIS